MPVENSKVCALGLGMTSRLIRSGQPDLLFNSIPGQSGVFQPPGPLHQVTQVAAHGKRAGPLVGFYHSAGRQPANSTPRPAGGLESVDLKYMSVDIEVLILMIITSRKGNWCQINR